MKKLIAILLALALAAAALPVFAADAGPDERWLATDAAIDTDGSDGYTGDYVVIYNPSTSYSNSRSTGNMAGLIKTGIDPYPEAQTEPAEGEALVRIDVDPLMSERAEERCAGMKAVSGGHVKRSFEVGDTRTFYIDYYSPAGSSMQFKVLAKGEHCYVWTPTSQASNVYPLDSIDPSFAQQAADEFDSKFALMQESFGDHENGSEGDGRLHLMYYNIDDGWTPGQGYVGGYFYAFDLYSNGLPMLHIDTYPGVHYVDLEGNVTDSMTRSYSTMVHEYQHLINYSQTGGGETWMTECMSAAAEEICYPGSCISGRIRNWTNYGYNDPAAWEDPPAEFAYNPSLALHKGFSMYNWDNGLPMEDLLALYGQAALFAQYVFTRHGNTFFHALMQQFAQGRSFVQAYQNITGEQTADFVADFRVALTANTAAGVLGGVYGFRPQEGYDPANYNGVQNLYSLLGPVVFTGDQCSIKGGGAVCVKPEGGVYYPPSGADGGLRYYGVTRTASAPHTGPLPGDVDLNGAVATNDALLALRYSMGLMELGPDNIAAGDLDGDGALTPTDALLILRRVMGLG